MQRLKEMEEVMVDQKLESRNIIRQEPEPRIIVQQEPEARIIVPEGSEARIIVPEEPETRNPLPQSLPIQAMEHLEKSAIKTATNRLMEEE